MRKLIALFVLLLLAAPAPAGGYGYSYSYYPSSYYYGKYYPAGYYAYTPYGWYHQVYGYNYASCYHAPQVVVPTIALAEVKPLNYQPTLVAPAGYVNVGQDAQLKALLLQLLQQSQPGGAPTPQVLPPGSPQSEIERLKKEIDVLREALKQREAPKP